MVCLCNGIRIRWYIWKYTKRNQEVFHVKNRFVSSKAFALFVNSIITLLSSDIKHSFAKIEEENLPLTSSVANYTSSPSDVART